MNQPYDCLVIGAGPAGAVAARELAERGGRRVLVLERRNHVGGNTYDRFDESGVLIHQYGPHIFHTNSRRVFEYLSRFTAWRPYEHKVVANIPADIVASLAAYAALLADVPFVLAFSFQSRQT